MRRRMRPVRRAVDRSLLQIIAVECGKFRDIVQRNDVTWFEARLAPEFLVERRLPAVRNPLHEESVLKDTEFAHRFVPRSPNEMGRGRKVAFQLLPIE